MIPAQLKGKAKAQDFDDLDPVLTYRHILQNNLGTRDPLRVVALCDSDAFYAACEMVRLGIKDKPLVVLQWEGIIAVNYPARKFGINRFHKLKDAKERCPELIIVHVATYKEGELEPGYWDNVDSRTHKVSLDYYRRESAKVLAMYKESLPNAEIEKASIDEVFIDFTKPVRQALIERYPYLTQVPPDAPNGVDTPLPPPPSLDWGTDSHLISINPDEDSGPTTSEDSPPLTWHDVALQLAAEIMQKVRVEIATKLGYTTSAGIARNKFLAKLMKLCASYRKPFSQTILRNQAIPNYLKPLEFQKIRFLGGKLGEALAKEYDVSTVAELLPIPLEELQSKFGESAVWVYEILRGIDRNEVKEKSPVNKSMLAAKALQKPITKIADGPHWIRVLAAELALRLNDARKDRPTLWPKTLVLHAGHGYGNSRSKQAPFPFTKEITVDIIAAAGGKLWKELVGNVTGPFKISILSLGFTGIEVTDASQQSISDFLSNTSTVTGTKRPSAANGNSPKRTRRDTPHTRSRPSSPMPTGQDTSFTCSECHKTFSLSSKLLSSTSDAWERAQALAAMQHEHNDFHYAQSVAREVEPEVKRAGPKKIVQVQKNDSRPKGIEKFFSRT
ncbi:hypothetical protein EV360DRAFT_82985 [Lentinula raphanica]|nr:hypothetical protein EV360DRAFT_82985 [Lentinula raphanica]